MKKVVLFIIVIISFIGCSTKNLSPANVSDYFWLAQKKRDYSDVKKFVRKRDQNDLKLQKSIKIRDFKVDKAILNDTKTAAKVPTKLYLQGFFQNDPNDVVEVDFDTILKKEDGSWRVDLKETRSILYMATIKKFGSKIGTTIFTELKDKIGVAQELQKTMMDILKNFANSIKKVSDE